MTDFSVSNAHTIIGATRFHDRVRDGIEWFPRAKVARRKGVEGASVCVRMDLALTHTEGGGRVPRLTCLGCCGVKPHG